MRYQPTDLPDRSHVGERWTRYQLRSLQIILQATHGVVSGDPEFFERAFGGTASEFETLLLRPHRYIFNRDWYEKHEGRAEFEEYRAQLDRLNDDEKAELLGLLSSCDPRDFAALGRRTQNTKLRRVLEFYKPIAKDQEARIWMAQKALSKVGELAPAPPEEELVEDAGLEEDSFALAASPQRRNLRRKLAVVGA